MREGVSVKDSYLESVRRWCAYLYLRDIRYSIKKIEYALSELIRIHMNYPQSTCTDRAYVRTIEFSGICVICLQSVFPSIPFTSVTSFTSTPCLLSHERQSITEY